MGGQDALSTRAIEIATQALTRVDSHEKQCSERYGEITRQHVETTDGQKAIFNKLDQLQRNGFWMWLTVAGATITVLLTVVGYLLTRQGVV